MKMIFALSLLFYYNSTLAEDHVHFEDYEAEKTVYQTEDINQILILGKGETNHLGVKVKTRNFTSSDLQKLTRAVLILKAVINSEEFKQAVFNFTFDGERQFHQNNNMTNKEIYQHLKTGAENMKPDVDHTMDFDLTMYRSWNPFSKVKGYTKPDTMRIWIHSKFYRRHSWSPVDVAANMAHEWVHKMGFGHDYYNNDQRPFSVPYAVGGLVIKTAKKLGY